MADQEKLRQRISTAHADAMKVHDSPVRADRLAAELDRITRDVRSAALGDERTARVDAALADAMRVLRRDDDGREAARHLQSALKQFESRPSRRSPFLDDM